MKILIATGIFLPEIGGPATYVYQLGKRLVEQGHQVALICYSKEGSYPEDKEMSFLIRRVKRKSKLYNYLSYIWQLFYLSRDYDLIYLTDTLSAGLAVWLVSKLRGCPYVLRVGGDPLWEKWTSKQRKKVTLVDFYQQGFFQQKKLLFYFIRLIGRGAKKVIFNARQLKNLWQKHFGWPADKLLTIYNPLPEKGEVNWGAKKEIFFVGRLSYLKNIDLLIKSFTQANLPGFKLVIIGEGPEKDRLVKLARQLQIGKQIEWLPVFPPAELWQRIKQGACLVLPSLTDISPNLIGEAVAHNFPFLLTKYNFLPFLIPEILLFNPLEENQLREKLDKLADFDFRQKLQRAVTEIDWRWDWEGVVQKHEKIFSSIL